MRLLLDTHVILWNLGRSRSLGAAAVKAIDSADELYVSAVSFAEIGVKVSVGKLHVPSHLIEDVFASGVKFLGLSPEHGLGVGDLPLHHRDPFDRLLVSQARLEGLAVVTADERIMRYDVACVPALT